MFKLISLVTLQSALLAASDILKKALIAFGRFSGVSIFQNVFTNLSFARVV